MRKYPNRGRDFANAAPQRRLLAPLTTGEATPHD